MNEEEILDDYKKRQKERKLAIKEGKICAYCGSEIEMISRITITKRNQFNEETSSLSFCNTDHFDKNMIALRHKE